MCILYDWALWGFVTLRPRPRRRSKSEATNQNETRRTFEMLWQAVGLLRWTCLSSSSSRPTQSKHDISWSASKTYVWRTQYVEGIYRPKYYTVTLNSSLRVIQGHWKWYHLKAWVRFPIRLPQFPLKLVPFESSGAVCYSPTNVLIIFWSWGIKRSATVNSFTASFNSNYGAILYRLREIANFFILHLAPPQKGDPVGI